MYNFLPVQSPEGLSCHLFHPLFTGGESFLLSWLHIQIIFWKQFLQYYNKYKCSIKKHIVKILIQK